MSLVDKIREHTAPILPYLRRYWMAHLLCALIIPPSAVTLAVFIYSVIEGIPPLSVIDDMGWRIGAVAVVAVTLFLIMVIYGSLPAIMQLFGEKEENEGDCGRLVQYIRRIVNTSGIAILSYIALSTYILDKTLYDNAIMAPILISTSLMSVAIIVFQYVRCPSRKWERVGGIILINFMSFTVMTLVYLTSVIAAAENDRSLISKVYDYISSTVGGGWANAFASALFVLIPIFAIAIMTVRRKDPRRTIAVASVVSLFMLLVWPGALAFIAGAFKILQKGGGAHVVFWMPAEAGCRHAQMLVDSKACSDTEVSKIHIKMGPVRLAFLDKEFLYIRVDYDVPAGATAKRGEYESMLLIPRTDISSLLFLGRQKIKSPES